MKTIFKVGDKVYDFRYGWGDVVEICKNSNIEYPIVVKFNYEIKNFTTDGRYLVDELPSLSFTYYDLVNGGFSQVRPKPKLPEINEGDVAYFGIYYHKSYAPCLDEGIEWKVGYFVKMENGRVTFKMSKDAKLPSIAVLLAIKNPLLNHNTPIYKAEDYI